MRTKIAVEKIGAFTGHKDCLYSLEKAPEEQTFFSSGSDGLVAKWSLQKPDEGTLVAKIPNTVYAMCSLPEKRELVVGQNFEGLHVISLEDNTEKRTLKLKDKAIFDIKYHDDKLYVALGDGHLMVIDYEGMNVLQDIQLSTKNLRCLAIHPVQGVVLVGGSDHTIRVVDLDSLVVRQELNAHERSVFSLSFTPDYRYLLSGGMDAHMHIWDAENNFAHHQDIVAHMYTINDIAFRADGRYFATCSKDKSVKVWDAKEFRLLKVIDRARNAGHGTSVNKLIWLDDNTLASCSDDRTVSVWKLTFES
ncbi:WD40 repeat domain-containing protein [Algivirga pacifica]|uniref:WD40 repeat domain-containing protein n=1 Tax=Algivirga pacifica TaxID=1162670 RepID=A0ABP9DH79_9BACT